MPRSVRLKLYGFVSLLVETGTRVLARRTGLGADEAHTIMLDIAREFCWRNAKSTVYIPEAINLTQIDRDAGIWAAYQQPGPAARPFTFQRIDELAAEHGLTRQRIYTIISTQRELARDSSDEPAPLRAGQAAECR